MQRNLNLVQDLIVKLSQSIDFILEIFVHMHKGH